MAARPLWKGQLDLLDVATTLIENKTAGFDISRFKDKSGTRKKKPTKKKAGAKSSKKRKRA